MSAYLARLKNIDADNFIIAPIANRQNRHNPPFDGFVGDPPPPILKNNSDVELISNWWLIHFSDIESVQVAIWPPCNHAGAMAFNPTAINAEPIPSPIDQTMEVITNE